MKNLIKIWKERGAILEGITNSVFKNEHVEEIRDERSRICNRCPHIDTEGKACIVPGTAPCCGVCGCSLQFLQRSLSSACQDGRWDAVLSQSEDDQLQQTLNPS